jgi:hypothetical protein
MDKFMNSGVKKLDMSGQYTNESTPASAPAGANGSAPKNYGAFSSDGPMILDAGKSGTGGVNDISKINSMANQHNAQVDAGK